MTWTYSGDPSSSAKDTVRFYLQDTDSTDPLMQDEEITFLINNYIPNMYSDYTAVAARCAEVLAAKFTREVSSSADGVTIGVQELQQKYTSLAKELWDTYNRDTGLGGGPDVGGISVFEDYDPTVAPLWAGEGQFDNLRAGNQNFGGIHLPEYPYDPAGPTTEFY